MSPYILEACVVLLGLILLMLEAFGPANRKDYLGITAIAGLVFCLILLFVVGTAEIDPAKHPEMARFYTMDSAAVFFKGLAIVCTILVLLLAIDYKGILAKFTENPGSQEGTGEYYALPVFACAGMMWMASAKDLVSIFVALELVTITFYILVAFMRRNVGSLEAGVKYLILGALSTGFLVYGIAWIYGVTGTTDLSLMAERLSGLESSTPALFGLALVLLALAFKIGAVPMQLWVPDVYQGAPTPTTAFLSVGSKAAGFIITIRILTPFFDPISQVQEQTTFILLVLGGLTILYGNLAAIPQTNFKRLLAYSSIAHAGFILLAITAWDQQGSDTSLTTTQAVGFYLATYLLMTIGIFFALVTVRKATGSEEIAAFDGLGKRNPTLALAITVLLSALAGLPLTAGFYGKFFAFKLAIDGANDGNVMLWWGVALGFVGVAAGFYYYLKVVRAMYWRSNDDTTAIEISPIARYVISTLTIIVVILGFWPDPVLWLLGA